MAKIYFYDFSSYNGNIENLCSSLFENEYKKIKNEIKRKQFIFSRILLRYALSENGFTEDEIVKNENGKPYFKRGYPSFSISHSANAVCVALSEKKIGVDVQKRKKISDRLTERFFSDSEKKYIKSGITTACDIWSIKESIIKYEGSAISLSKKRNEVQIIGEKVTVKDRALLNISNFSDENYNIYVCSEDTENNFYYINMP